MYKSKSVPIYLLILNGLRISNENVYYDIPNHIEDVVVIDKTVDKTINEIYNSIVLENNGDYEDEYILDIFDKIIQEPTNNLNTNKLNKNQIKLPNYIFYPELYRHKYQLIMGVYKTEIEFNLNNEYKYKYLDKLYSNYDLNYSSYTYSMIFNEIIKTNKEKCMVGFFISNLNKEPLVDKVKPSYTIFNNIEFLGPNEIDNKIQPYTFPYKGNEIVHTMWNGNIAQYYIGCGISTLLYYKLISYDFAINELSKMSKYGTSIWRIMEYCIINKHIDNPIGIVRFPIKIGYLFLCDFLLKSKIKKQYIIFRTCFNENENNIINDRGHTASLLKLNNRLFNIDPYLNEFNEITTLKNVNEYYSIYEKQYKHTHIDFPIELNENGITLNQLKQLKGIVRTRLPLTKMSFGGK
jgi:hypothetical protein